MSCDEWKSGKLGDVCFNITDGKHGDCKNQGNSGYFFVSVKDIYNDKINYQNARQITAADFIETHKRTKLGPNDILITNSGTIGRMALVKDGEKTKRTTFQKSVAIIKPNTKIVDAYYLFYNIRANIKRLAGLAGGTTQKNLLLKDIRNFSIKYPPLPNQKAIADTLSCLDDKIELNNRINKTLEEMAQAIFKSWFVDFEPFQDGEFEDSELGPIPKGWRVGPVEELCEIQIGGDWGKDANLPGLVPVICLRGTDLQKIKETGYSEEAPQRWVKPSSIDNRALTNHDIIIGGSGLGPVGRSICFDDTIEQLYPHPVTYSNFCKRVKAYSRSDANYIEQIIEMLYVRGDLKRNYVNGTSVPNLDLQGLMKHRVVIPPENVVSKFAALKQRIFKLKCSGENPQLARVRDTLLPKLMSGEIRVPIEEVQ